MTENKNRGPRAMNQKLTSELRAEQAEALMAGNTAYAAEIDRFLIRRERSTSLTVQLFNAPRTREINRRRRQAF